MKTLWKILFLSCIFFFLRDEANAQKDTVRWTPRACIQYAILHNPEILAAENMVVSDSLQLIQSKAERFPGISAGADYNYSWVSSTGSNATATNTENINASASANFVIYNGRKISMNIRKSALQMSSDSLSREFIITNVAENIATAYLQSLYNAEELNISKEQLSLSVEQTKVAQTKLDLKEMTRTDFLQISADEASSHLQWVKAGNQLNSSQLNLNKLMQLPSDSIISLVPPEEWFIRSVTSASPFDSVLQAAMISRPDIRVAEKEIGMRELDIKIARADQLPSLSFKASTGWNQNLMTTSATGQINATAGLSLTVPIFNHKQVRTNIAISQISLENQKTSYESAVFNLKVAIEELMQDIKASEAEWQSATIQLELALESYNAAIESFALGRMQTVDLLSRKTELNNARHNVLKAKYNLILSEIILQLYTSSWNQIK